MCNQPKWLNVDQKIWLHGTPFEITDISNTQSIEIKNMDGQKFKHNLIALFKSGHVKLADPILEPNAISEELLVSPSEHKRMHEIAYDLQKLYDTAWRGKKAAKEAIAQKYSVSTRQVHRWLISYKEKGLAGLKSKTNLRGNRGKKMLPSKTEKVIEEGINEYLLTRTPVSTDECIRLIRSKCTVLNTHVPSPNTVRNRINKLPKKTVLKAQKGNEHANDMMRVSRDTHDVATRPLQDVQADHSPLDLIVVDSEGTVIGRPTLTVILDVYTRMILGIYIGWEHPSFDNFSWALEEAIFPKDHIIEKYQIDGEWPSYGLMESLHSDNGGEFDGENLDFFVKENFIDKVFRPKGQKHFGGHVETVIGTIQEHIHTFPGTTFSNPKKKGNYNAEAEATLELEDAREIVYRWIAERYHTKERDELEGLSPAEKWNQSISNGWRPRVHEDEATLRRSLLPSHIKSINSHGVNMFGHHYTSPGLTHWKSLEERGKPLKYRIHYDARDVRWAYFVHPDGSGVTKLSSTTLKVAYPVSLKQLKDNKIKSRRFPAASPHIFLSHEKDREVINRARSKKSKKMLRNIAQQEDATKRIVGNMEESNTPDNIDYSSIPDWVNEVEDNEC